MWYSLELIAPLLTTVVVLLSLAAYGIYRYLSRQRTLERGVRYRWRSTPADCQAGGPLDDTEESLSASMGTLGPESSIDAEATAKCPAAAIFGGAVTPVQGQYRPTLLADAQFTVYRPQRVLLSTWYDCLAFAHLATKPPGAPADAPSPIEQVREQARRILSEQAECYRESTQDARSEVPLEAQLSFVPSVDGGEFNPPCRSFRWCEAVHREDFRMRIVAPEKVGQTTRPVTSCESSRRRK